jgi:tRNA A37 threonylcarbamoyladenosine dehydratase
MYEDFRDRTAILLGGSGMEALEAASVAVYGLGGVGAACAMDLARAGVGRLYVVDFDRVEESNLNRLYFGYSESIGLAKTEAFARFARSVNPSIRIEERRIFFTGHDAAKIVDATCAYHADCVDSLNAKANLIAALCSGGSSFISSMGTAGRLEPERLRLGDIWETKGCPLAKSLRTRLKHMGISASFPVVWSDEPPVKPVSRHIPQAAPAVLAGGTRDAGREEEIDDSCRGRAPASATPRGRARMVQGSSPFVPQSAGHIMAAWIVRRIVGDASGKSC